MASQSIDTSKLDSLREQYNTEPQSEDSSPFPLWALLALYEKAYPAAYTDYMLGFALLRDWLAPIDISLTDCDSDIPEYPELLSNYEIQQIARLTNTTENYIIHTIIHKGYYTYD